MEAVLEGPRGDVEQAIARLRQGPPASRVDDIAIQWQEPEGLPDFTIRYA